MAVGVKGRSRVRRKGISRISAKHQVTIPVDAMRRAGWVPGTELRFIDAGGGRVLVERNDDPIRRHAGTLTGVYPKGYLKKLRSEWRS